MTGKPIPPELVVSLPRDDDPESLINREGIIIAKGMEWMVDFAEAEAVGMAVTLTLNPPTRVLDRVLAFGVRSSLDPAAGARELEGLLTAHRFASGAAFIPQGTPTNNTESDRAAWQRRPTPARARPAFPPRRRPMRTPP